MYLCIYVCVVCVCAFVHVCMHVYVCVYVCANTLLALGLFLIQQMYTILRRGQEQSPANEDAYL